MLKFRPHHFLCAVGFAGMGYSDEFTENMAEIVRSLRKNGDEITIEVTAHADSICAPCPHRRGEGCETAAKISALDEAHAETLRVRPGDQLSWGEAKQRIIANISVEKHHEICAPCAWRPSGVCERALTVLLNREGRGSP